MTSMWVTPGQMAAAGSYIAREWGDSGYAIEAIETSSDRQLSHFHVVAGDGARFIVSADRWGNCQELKEERDDLMTTDELRTAYKALGSAAFNMDLDEYCEALGIANDSYARDKYWAFQRVGQFMAQLSDSMLARLAEHHRAVLTKQGR